MLSRQLLRKFTTSAIRRSGHEEVGGKPARNLPFSTDNKYKLTAIFIVFFGSGISVPWLMVRHQLLK